MSVIYGTNLKDSPRAAATEAPETPPHDEKMRGQNIICFAKDWDEDPTSNNHVMRLLARDNRVLWLNSISMRTPKLGSWPRSEKDWSQAGRLFPRAKTGRGESLDLYADRHAVSAQPACHRGQQVSP